MKADEEASSEDREAAVSCERGDLEKMYKARMQVVPSLQRGATLSLRQ